MESSTLRIENMGFLKPVPPANDIGREIGSRDREPIQYCQGEWICIQCERKHRQTVDPQGKPVRSGLMRVNKGRAHCTTCGMVADCKTLRTMTYEEYRKECKGDELTNKG